MIRADDHDGALLGVDAEVLVHLTVALVVALVVEEDLVQVTDVVLAREGVEGLGNLLEFGLVALAVGHDDGLDQAVDISALGSEAEKRALIGAEIASKL